jgi:hypothetical protein
MYRLYITTREHGALLSALRATAVMDEFCDDLEDAGADWALDNVKQKMRHDFRRNTGVYMSTVRKHNTVSGPEIWDGGHAGLVYGPWLEGVGSRNLTTRFKGYWAFRRTASELQRRIDNIAEHMFNLHYRFRLDED